MRKLGRITRSKSYKIHVSLCEGWEATDASHQHIATASQPRLRRRGERPWPGSTPLRLRSRGRQHFPGQTPTLHTCEAEGDNTSLARYYTFTSAKPRDDPGQTPHRHTATAHGSASQIRKFSTTSSPPPSSRTSSGRRDNRVSYWNSTLPQLQTTTAAPSLPQ